MKLSSVALTTAAALWQSAPVLAAGSLTFNYKRGPSAIISKESGRCWAVFCQTGAGCGLKLDRCNGQANQLFSFTPQMPFPGFPFYMEAGDPSAITEAGAGPCVAYEKHGSEYRVAFKQCAQHTDPGDNLEMDPQDRIKDFTLSQDLHQGDMCVQNPALQSGFDWNSMVTFVPCASAGKGFATVDNSQTKTLSAQIAPPQPTASPTSDAPTTASPTSDAPTTASPTSTPQTPQGGPSSGEKSGVHGKGGLAKKPFLAPAPPSGGSGGDPHFKTWNGNKFDFHGGCALMFLSIPSFYSGVGLDIHIRTRIETWWSYIEAAVVRIGDHTLEISGGEAGQGPNYWINGSPGASLVNEVQLGQTQLLEESLEGFDIVYRHASPHSHRFRIDLGSGGALSLETFNRFVRVNVKASSLDGGATFDGAIGMMGSFPSGDMLARDGTTTLSDPAAYGLEWQVLASEPMLFHTVEGVQHPQTCRMPSLDASAARQKRRRLGEVLISMEDAHAACAHAALDEVDACVSDVLATNDKVTAGAY